MPILIKVHFSELFFITAKESSEEKCKYLRSLVLGDTFSCVVSNQWGTSIFWKMCFKILECYVAFSIHIILFQLQHIYYLEISHW